MLEHALRVRDLVHGFVMHTELEKDVINHRFFQRLREVRQNGVSLLAYPSLTTSYARSKLWVQPRQTQSADMNYRQVPPQAIVAVSAAIGPTNRKASDTCALRFENMCFI